jgi:chemotaxis protein histidine kinase CheA
LRAEGTSETRAQADAVKAVRTELEATIATAKAAGVAPKDAFTAAKAKQKKEEDPSKATEKETANAEKKRVALEKAQAREDATRKKAEEKKRLDLERASDRANKDLEKYAKDEAKAAEQRAAEAIEPEMRKLSLIEKAQKKAESNKKKAEKEADEKNGCAHRSIAQETFSNGEGEGKALWQDRYWSNACRRCCWGCSCRCRVEACATCTRLHGYGALVADLSASVVQYATPVCRNESEAAARCSPAHVAIDRPTHVHRENDRRLPRSFVEFVFQHACESGAVRTIVFQGHALRRVAG